MLIRVFTVYIHQYNKIIYFFVCNYYIFIDIFDSYYKSARVLSTSIVRGAYFILRT